MTIVCEPDPSIAVAVASCTDDAESARMVADLGTVECLLLEDDSESIVVIGPGVDLVELLSFVARTGERRPEVHVILLRDRVNASVRELVIDRGVDAVIATRDLALLADACRSARDPRPGEAGPAGRVIAVHGATSGQGRTTLAANLAVVLNGGGARRVCLVDLDLAFGDLTCCLARRPEQAAERPNAPSSPLTTPYLPGLDCLFAPDRPGEAAAIAANQTEDALTGLACCYDYVIVDTPQLCTAQVLSTLDVANHHVLVTVAERPALRNLRRTLDMLDLLEYPLESRTVVLNRCDPRVMPTPTEIDLVLRSRVSAMLPWTADVPASINQGLPLALSKPDHPFVQAVRRLAGVLTSTVPTSGESGA